MTNFVSPDGRTSPFGIRVADQLAHELARQGHAFAVIDRAELQQLLDRERISSRLQNEDPVARWLARTLNANVVLVGKIEKMEENAVEIMARLLSVNEEKRAGPLSGVRLAVREDGPDFLPSDGLPALDPITTAANGEKIYRPGNEGASLPRCSSTPNPTYTGEARKAKFSGSLTGEGIVEADGTVTLVRIVKGAPYWLNASALETLAPWKCVPAKLGGLPVATLTFFEVDFQLF